MVAQKKEEEDSLRIGISLGSLLSVEDLVQCAKKTESYSVSGIWIPATWGMESFSVISAISQHVTCPILGSSIVNVFSRTPTLVGMSAATLDTLSNGRIVLGLGVSSKPIVEDWHGLPYSHPLKRMKEYIDIIRMVAGGERVTYSGSFFALKNFKLLIKPVRKNIPIYLAAVNPKMVELAWDVADGVIFYLRPKDELQKTISKMQAKRKIDVCCQLITAVHTDGEMAITRAKKTLAFYISVGKVYREFLRKNGFEREATNIYEEYKETGLKSNHELVTSKMLESLTVCGAPDDAFEKLCGFYKTGLDMPILQFNPVGENIQESFDLVLQSLVKPKE